MSSVSVHSPLSSGSGVSLNQKGRIIKFSITDAEGTERVIFGARPLRTLHAAKSNKVVLVQIEDSVEAWEVTGEDVVYSLIRCLRDSGFDVVAWQVGEVNNIFKQSCPTCGSQIQHPNWPDELQYNT